MTKEEQDVAKKVASIIRKKFPNSAIDIDDIKQEALIAVWKASQRYDPERGTPYSAWLYENAILACTTYMNENGRPVSAGARAMIKHKIKSAKLTDAVIEDSRPSVNLESDYAVKQFATKLPQDKARWLSSMIDGSSLREAADDTGICALTSQKWRKQMAKNIKTQLMP